MWSAAKWLVNFAMNGSENMQMTFNISAKNRTLSTDIISKYQLKKKM